MVSYTDQKPIILTAAEADLQRAEAKARQPGIHTNPSSRRSSGVMAYILGALVLIVVGYLLFSNNWNTMSMFPTVTETLPAPDVNTSVSPDTSTPPPSTAPKYTPPVTP